jgi:Family of unknown function (DUF5906)/Primase C terminal 2 (PriCT-2)
MPPQSAHSPALGTNIVAGVFDKPPPVEVMHGMLTHLNERGYFADRLHDANDISGGIVSIGWIKAGMALKVAYGDKDGFDLWAITHRNDEARNDAPAQWKSFHVDARPGDVTIGTIIKAARQSGFPMPGVLDGPAEVGGDVAGAVDEGVRIHHFRAYMPLHSYIFMPSREMWPASSVNSRIPPIPLFDKNGMPLLDDKGKQKKQVASLWLDINQPVEQMTWAPGEPMLIPDRLVANGGWLDHGGATCFNLYRPPAPQSGGDANKAGPWLDHIRKVFPDDAEHIIKWFAHRVQRPQEKINHALVFGGAQGIGKDTILEPLKRAIRPWNFEEVSPQQMLGRFNGFLKSVVLRVSEARDLGDVDRFQFYDHMKVYTASPPDVLRVDEKHLREHYVFNCCGVIVTTNHKTDGIYLPADDRRHFVAWSDCAKEDFPLAYWNGLWGWYEAGGYAHVAAYLSKLDISSFDPKAPPPKTPAFWDIADANRAPEDAELADVLDKMGNPDAVTLSQIKDATCANFEFHAWIRDRKNRRAIRHRLEKCGFVPVRNDADKSDGQWRIGGSRVTVYAKKELSLKERLGAAEALAAGTVGENGKENLGVAAALAADLRG